MNFEKLMRNIRSRVYENKMEYPSRFFNSKYQKLSLDYIFDKNLSIEENRKMVLKHNDNIDYLVLNYQVQTDRLNDIFFDDVIDSIEDKYGFNEEICREIYDKADAYCYNETKYDIAQLAEEYADFAYEILTSQ